MAQKDAEAATEAAKKDAEILLAQKDAKIEKLLAQKDAEVGQANLAASVAVTSSLRANGLLTARGAFEFVLKLVNSETTLDDRFYASKVCDSLKKLQDGNYVLKVYI